MMSEWQLRETAPKDGSEVLVWDHGVITQAAYEQGGWFSIDGGLVYPTHWMPLPEPPKNE